MLRKIWKGTVAIGVATLALNSTTQAATTYEGDFDVAAFCSDCEPSCEVGCDTGCDVTGESCGIADSDCGETAYCGTDDCACGNCWCPQPWAHTTSVWGEFVYLHPVGADMAHAQQQNGTGGAGTVPFGRIGVADPQFSPGARIGGSVCLSQCSSITASYLFLETDSRDYLTVPGQNLQVGSLVHHPGTALTASNGPVSATYDLDFQLADVMYRRLISASNSGWVNYSAGVGYANIDQEFSQRGPFSGSLVPALTTTELNFDGYGLRIGIDGEHKLGCTSFSTYGKANASAMFGEFRGDYRMLNTTTLADLAFVRWTDDRVVPTLEYELGLAWTSCSGRVRASIGYTGIHFLNMVTTPDFVDAVQANNYSDVDGSVSLEGAVSRIELRY